MAAAARRAQETIRTSTTAVVRTLRTPRREISMASEAREGAWTTSGRASLKERRGVLLFQSRCMSSAPNKPTPPTPGDLKLAKVALLSEMLAKTVKGISPAECSSVVIMDLKKKLSDVEKQVVVLEVKLRHIQAGYWSSFIGFTTILTMLPAWVYYIQLDSTTAHEDVKKLDRRVEKLEAENASKVSKVDVEVKFPHQDS